MENQKKKPKIVIENVAIIRQEEKENGNVINVSFRATKQGGNLADTEYSIRINGKEIEPIEGENTTDKYGFASQSFHIKKADEITAMIIVENEEEKNKPIVKQSKKFVLKKQTPKDITGSSSSFYAENTPQISAKLMEVWKIASEDYFANTGNALAKFNDFLKSKTNYQKSWLLDALTKTSKEAASRFLEVLLNIEEELDKPNAKKDEYAKNLGFLPLCDIQQVFNSHLNALQKTDKAKFDQLIDALAKLKAEELKNFHFNCSHMNENEFIENMTNAVSDNTNHTLQQIKIRGLINKPKK